MAHGTTRSPLAPEVIASLPPVPGAEFAAAACGVRYPDRLDVMLARFAPGTQVAGLLTRSRMPGAPVDWCRRLLPAGHARALVVNAGNSNVFTGRAGVDAATATAKAAAAIIGCAADEVYLASTGVIGEPLPYHRITERLPELAGSLAADGAERASEAMLTTDTFPKRASREIRIGETAVTLNGMAKGSGMIAPDMATMLAFLWTDAALAAPVLRALLGEAARTTLNAVSVDGDMSTSDMTLLFATGQASNPAPAGADDPLLDGFREALHGLMRELALLIARDGEGASKLVTVQITGAESEASAKRIARAIADSPLVKTAIAGQDANWGRVVMAVGKSGEPADRDRLTIRFGDITVAEHGLRRPDYDESRIAAYMRQPEIAIGVDVGVGVGAFTVWSCDLTHGYIAINGNYRS